MTNRKENYKDMNKYYKTKREMQYRYYHRMGTGIYKRRSWTEAEDNLVVKHPIPDRELSKRLKRSVKSIQMRRHKLKTQDISNKGTMESILEAVDDMHNHHLQGANNYDELEDILNN